LENGGCKEVGLELLNTGFSDSYSDEDLNVEAFHNLPIDELVKLINNSPKRKQRKKEKHLKSSTAINNSAIDKENLQNSETPPTKAIEPSETLQSPNVEETKNTENPFQDSNPNLKPSKNTADRPDSSSSKPKNEKKSKSRLNTAENSSSPLREEVDKEIESFRQRLELEKPFEVKRRPLISDEFLLSLRSQLKLK
jgi:hypothetical protein